MVTQDILKLLLSYDPESGIFLWKMSRRNGTKSGDIAGGRTANGYLQITIGRPYLQHRLAFLYMTGSIPDCIDHINGIKSDNRWENIRPVTFAENLKNKSLPKSNKSGVPGVGWYAASNKWRAKIKSNGVMHHLGYFERFEDAVKARKAAEKRFGFHENHGRMKHV